MQIALACSGTACTEGPVIHGLNSVCPELDLGALTVEDWLRKQRIPETVTLMNPISSAGYFGNLYICSKRTATLSGNRGHCPTAKSLPG